MSQNSLGQYFSDLLYEVVYETTYRGFKATISDDRWIELSIAVLVEDARMAIIVWLTESDSPNPSALSSTLVAASDAFCSMMCLERAGRTESSICDHVADVMAEGWSPDVESVSVHLPTPDDPSAKRRRPENILARCR